MKKNIITAEAYIKGSEKYPDITGYAGFAEVQGGTLVSVALKGLPKGGKCGKRIFAAHIHEGMSCSGNKTDLFADAKGHFNPDNCPHPFHAGDLPPLFASDGTATAAFITKSFKPKDVIGRTIIIHGGEDDFMTQPSGNSGEKIACGVIKKCM